MSCALYTLFRGINSGAWKWYDYVIHVINMVSTMVIAIGCFWEIAKYTTLAKALFKLSIAAFRNVTCSMGVAYSLAIQLMTVLGAGALFASGCLLSIARLGSAVSTSKYTGEYMTDIITSLGHLIGVDLTDRTDLNKAIIARTKKLHDYLALPTSAWTGNKYAEIESFSQECRLMVQTNNGIGDTVTLQSFMKVINDVDEWPRSIREEWVTRMRRPVPVGLYLWSE